MRNRNSFLSGVLAVVFWVLCVSGNGWSFFRYNTPEVPVSDIELNQQDAQDLEKLFPPFTAKMFAVYLQFPAPYPQSVREKGEQFLLKNPDIENQLSAMDRLALFQEILQTIDQRHKHNEEVKNSEYNRKKNAQWRNGLPLHKSNLTFRGPNGEKSHSHSEITCPPDIENVKVKKFVCYEYNYADDVKSIFFFDEDMLAERDDVKNGRALARYTFMPTPFYSEKDVPHYSGVLSGAVSCLHRYDPRYTYPVEETVYADEEILSSQVLRDFEKQTQTSVEYYSDHRLHFYEKRVLDGTEANGVNTALRIEADYSIPPVYHMTFWDKGQLKQKTGKLVETRDGEIVLDMGLSFPPSTKLPNAQAPTYCTLYPKGCKHK